MNRYHSKEPLKRTGRARISYDLIVFSLAAIGIGLAGRYIISLAGTPGREILSWLFALSSDQAFWYVTRAAGMVAYLLLWFSTVWGLVIPSKLFGEALSPEFTFDFHKFISLLSLGFLGLHISVLTADRYLPFTVAQLLVPFVSPYRPLWVGIGIISFYLVLLVTITFYLRKQIGVKAFRYIHYTSLLAYLGAVAHALLSGTDSSLPAVILLYVGTAAVVVFLTVYWLVKLRVTRGMDVSPVITARRSADRNSSTAISRRSSG